MAKETGQLETTKKTMSQGDVARWDNNKDWGAYRSKSNVAIDSGYLVFSPISISDLPAEYHHWRLDETSGATTAVDSEGGLNGTYNNVDVGAVTGPEGEPVPQFNGGGYISLGSNEVYPDYAKHASVSIWFRADDVTTKQRLFDGAYAHNIQINNGTLSFLFGAAFRNKTILPAGTVTAGEWTHAGAVFNGNKNEMRTYLNGRQQQKGSTGFSILSNTSGAYNRIGDGYYTSLPFNGAIADLRTWGESLGDAEMQALADAGAAGTQ